MRILQKQADPKQKLDLKWKFDRKKQCQRSPLPPRIHPHKPSRPNKPLHQHPRRRNRSPPLRRRLSMPSIVQHNIRRPPPPSQPLNCAINAPAIRSSDVSLQSEVIAFHVITRSPSSRAILNTAGLRAPNGGRKYSTFCPLINSSVPLVRTSSSRTFRAGVNARFGWLHV